VSVLGLILSGEFFYPKIKNSRPQMGREKVPAVPPKLTAGAVRLRRIDSQKAVIQSFYSLLSNVRITAQTTWRSSALT
jgi:hypothetical protein